jgi:hypothetical protein
MHINEQKIPICANYPELAAMNLTTTRENEGGSGNIPRMHTEPVPAEEQPE